MKGCDVLLFGSMGNISEIAGESLRAHGLDVVSVSFPQNVCRDRAGYRRELFKAIQKYHPAMVMPVGNTLTMASLTGELPEGTIAAVGRAEHIAMLDSKISTYALAQMLDIPQPRRYLSPEEIEKYPVILKRDKSFGGSGVYKPRTRDALENLMAHEGNDFLIEEYVEGCDYSVDCVSDGIDDAKGMNFSIYRCTSNRGQGPSISRECVDYPLLGEYAGRILGHIGYKGVCGMDFRVDGKGKVCFLECNPRFCGGLGTQIQAGFDIPWMLYKTFLVKQKIS